MDAAVRVERVHSGLEQIRWTIKKRVTELEITAVWATQECT